MYKRKRLKYFRFNGSTPNDKNTKKYFKLLNELNNSLGLKELSMGMSSDYEDAILNNSTYVRMVVLFLDPDPKLF